MAKNFHQDGDVWDYTNTTGAAIKSGDPVAVGVRMGVALTDIAINAVGAVKMSGVFQLPKVTGSAWAQGAKLLWDKSAGKFDVGTATPATGDVSGCCVAAYAAASADAVGYVQLNVVVGAVT